jgi:adhesin transport system membrane fusion protein
MSKNTQHITLDKVLDDLGEPRWRASQRRLLAFFIIIFLWTLIGRVDRVVTAPGKVIPYDKVKVIQHLEGGIIKDILVRESQEVKAGDPLVQLDLATSGINSGEMNARMASLKLAKIRLETEASGAELVWPQELATKFPNLIEAENQSYQSKRDERRNSLQAFDNLVTQNRQKLAESRERLASLEASMKISKQEIAISEDLVRDKLTSQLDHFQRQTNYERLTGDIASLRQSITGLQAGISESIARRQQEEARFNREAAAEAADMERKMASLNEELSRAHDQEDRSVIRAPIDGVVKNVRFQTAGNVVKPGEPIMEVVPLKDQLVIEVKLSPSDRGYINLKQDALVKISTYDYLRYGGLDGLVTGIAADTDLGRNDEQFYRIIVSTDKSWLGSKQGQYPITPGMVGEVDIKVDTQSIMWALLKPVLKLKVGLLLNFFCTNTKKN